MRAAAFLVVTAALAGVLSACASDDGARKRVRVPPPDPGEILLGKLETRLMRAKTVHIEATLTSKGAVNADLTERVFLGDGQRAHVDVKGTFESRPVDTWFVCDGTSMQVRGHGATPAAPEVRDALVIGLVRLGLLHDAALLVGGDAPDHAAGGLRDFVKAERPRAGTPVTDIRFDVVVKHDVLGEAVLSLDDEEKPGKRTSKLSLEEGDLTTEEKYTLVDFDAPVDPALFSLTP